MNNAPARMGRGVANELGGYSDASTTTPARTQFLRRFGVPHNRVGLVAELAFGEARP